MTPLIAEVEAIPLRVVGADETDLDGSSETILIRITDEDGNAGVGEADAPAVAVRELVLMDDLHAWSRGLRGMLVGRDPFPIPALHDEMYQGTIYHARRGLGIHALSAIDIALHDLVGKQLGRPVYDLLGGARRRSLTPYATLYAGGVGNHSLAEIMDDLGGRAERALALGFRALKLEPLFEHLADDRSLADCIREFRAQIGTTVTLMVDFGYRWKDWRSALWTLNRVADCDVFFAEATVQHDDLEGHAKLAERVETRVCGGELAATLFECREFLEKGQVDVLQADINRCGGLTAIHRVAALAELHGALVIPHGWKTGITTAAQRHYQAATANAPWIEMFHPDLFDSPLRRELAPGEPRVIDGEIDLPKAPGLGIEVDEAVIERYRIDSP